MFVKVIAKVYELFLRGLCPVSVDYFCRIFESRPFAEPSGHDSTVILHVFIPFRDRWELTRSCLEGLMRQNKPNIHTTVHLIDNGSQIETQQQISEWISRQNSSMTWNLHRIDEPFNFSKLCNVALATKPTASAVEHFLFLNNDVVLDDPETLQKTSLFMERHADCGALGITLLFPDRSIQHLFAAPGVKIIAAHPFKGKSLNLLKTWNQRARRVPAVTGAFLMVPASRFHEVGGFDDKLATTGQDIDLCLKLQSIGCSNWVLPNLQATHFESASRKRTRINRTEVDYIYRKWGRVLTQHPEYPQRLSRWSEQPVMKILEGPYPYRFII